MNRNMWHVSRNRITVWAFFVFALPGASWAPDSSIDVGNTEITLNFQVLYFAEEHENAAIKFGGLESFSEKHAAELVRGLNRKFAGHNVKFRHQVNEVLDPNVYKIGKDSSRKTTLKRVARFSAPGVVTVVVPYQVPTPATYSGQYLAEGPVLVLPKEATSAMFEEQMGYLIGFTKNCQNASNVMYSDCGQVASQNSSSAEEGEIATREFFTADKTARGYDIVLTDWTRAARMYFTQAKLGTEQTNTLFSWRESLPKN